MKDLQGQLWGLLWSDIESESEFPEKRPLLAHYTSAQTLEAIFRGKQLWLSHPMLMNDLEELQWGIHAGIRVLSQHEGLMNACGATERFALLQKYLGEFVAADGVADAHSIFVACFCEHKQEEHDGLLSMWRAYGANGGGAAIIFDTGKLNPQDDSPFILSSVKYGSASQREEWISRKFDEVAGFLAANPSHIDEELLSIVAYFLLARLKVFALTTKHQGFEEEREWRLIYLPERDDQQKYTQYIDYAVSPSGFQPKMKLPLTPEVSGMIELQDLVTEIMLGPAHGSALSLTAVRRMLSLRGLDDLSARVRQSMTPFRPAMRSS